LFVEANKLKLQNRNIKLGQHFATKLKIYPSNHAGKQAQTAKQKHQTWTTFRNQTEDLSFKSCCF
jgi:hypothetical protein